MNPETTCESAEFVLKTDRLILRKVDPADADFILDLLNQPSFIKYIGDRGVRSIADAADFIEARFRQSYNQNGFGLYAVTLCDSGIRIGICGFVRRETLPGPDIGFAFLPEYEGCGYGFESASAMMEYGKDVLGFTQVYAITTLDNNGSIALLAKLGFASEGLSESPDGEPLRLFAFAYSETVKP